MTRSPLFSLALSALIFAGAGLVGGGSAQAKQFKVAPCVMAGTCNLKPLNPNTGKFWNGYGKKPPVYGYGYGHHHGWGYGAAALAGGMALGAIAASATSSSSEAGDCYFERRKALDEDGNVYIRRARVCE